MRTVLKNLGIILLGIGLSIGVFNADTIGLLDPVKVFFLSVHLTFLSTIVLVAYYFVSYMLAQVLRLAIRTTKEVNNASEKRKGFLYCLVIFLAWVIITILTIIHCIV